jgi:hypothetical protein
VQELQSISSFLGIVAFVESPYLCSRKSKGKKVRNEKNWFCIIGFC